MPSPAPRHSIRTVAIVASAVAVAVCVLSLAPAAFAKRASGPSGAACGSGWQRVPSPNPPDVHDFLNGVDAIAPTDAWAVGGRYNGSRQHTLIEHWDGRAWSIVPSPNMGGSSLLSSVSAIAPDDVWAVGTARNRVLTEHWDGSAWSVVPAPFRGSLEDVEAIDPTHVVAVGEVLVHHLNPLALRWTGSGWLQIHAAASGSPDPILFNSVAATGPTDIWAAGEAVRNQHAVNLSEHSGGDAFTQIRTPTPGRGEDRLLAVDAISPSDVWAVGDSIKPSFPSTSAHNVSEHWNGSSWRLVRTPTRHVAGFDQVDTSLGGVSAVGANEVWAVGYRQGYTDNGREISRRRTLSLEWNGARWRVVASPNAFGLRNSELRDVAALSDGHGWAVGAASSASGRVEKTLVLARC